MTPLELCQAAKELIDPLLPPGFTCTVHRPVKLQGDAWVEDEDGKSCGLQLRSIDHLWYRCYLTADAALPGWAASDLLMLAGLEKQAWQVTREGAP